MASGLATVSRKRSSARTGSRSANSTQRRAIISSRSLSRNAVSRPSVHGQLDIRVVRCRDERLHAHPPQDPAAETPAHEFAFPANYGEPALDRLDHRVESGKSQGVQHEMPALHQSEEPFAVERGYERDAIAEAEAAFFITPFQPLLQLPARLAVSRSEEHQATGAQSPRDLHPYRVVTRRVFERRTRTH